MRISKKLNFVAFPDSCPPSYDTNGRFCTVLNAMLTMIRGRGFNDLETNVDVLYTDSRVASVAKAPVSQGFVGNSSLAHRIG